jgi:hypothetical protein
MKNNTQTWRIFLFVLCVAASPLSFGEEPLTAEEEAMIQKALDMQPQATPEQKAQWRKTLEQSFRGQKAERARQQADADAYWARMAPKLVAPSGPSPWLEKERTFYVDLLVLAKPKVLVVPPTVPEDQPGIDISGRVTIARELSRLIEAEAGAVPDPAMVYRALGEPRSISVDEIRSKLDRIPPLPAEWLVVGTATHDGKGKMRVTFSKYPFARPLGGPSPAATATFVQDGIEISEENAPEIRFEPFAIAAAKALGYSGTPAGTTSPMRASALKLPASPADVAPEQGSLGGIWMQELIGLLHSPYELAQSRSRERVFERCVAALLNAPQDAPDRNLLLARAMAYLDRRPAALAVLGQPSTPEEKALSAYLRSDLTSLQAAMAEIKRPLPKLMSQIELVNLRFWAGTLPTKETAATLKALKATTPPAWHTLLDLHVLALDPWTVPEPASVKPVLDRDFPVPGYRIEDLVRGKAALGARAYDEKAGVELTLSPLVHAQKWRAMNVSALCCATGAATWGVFQRDQYLDLLEADADTLALEQLSFISRIQGQPDDMMRRADLYDSVLFAGGHPGVLNERLLATFAMMNGSSLERRVKLGAEGFELSRRVLTWQTTQSATQSPALAARESLGGWWLRTQGPIPGNLMKPPPPLAVERDFPFRVVWAVDVANNLSRGELSFVQGRSACSGTIADFSPCSRYAKALKTFKRFQERDALIKTVIEPRFHGYPARYELLASAKLEAGDAKTAEALLNQATKLPNASSSTYSMLGTLLLEDGRFAEASKVLLSFPGLKSARENPVGVSNYAFDAGEPLARAGAMAQARPLLQIAARNGDGSRASLGAAAQLALSDRHLRESIFYRQRAYQAYRNEVDAAAIASMLFAAGQPDDGWNVVAAVVPQARYFMSYRAATVGMRMLSYDAKAIINWREGVERRAGGLSRDPIALDLVMLAGVQMAFLDRDLSNFDELFETRPGGFVTWRSQPQSPDAINVIPVRFLPVYRAFRGREYQKAAEGLAPVLKSYDDAGYPNQLGQGAVAFWSTMPYYAFALAKVGRADEARALEHRLTPEGRPAGSRPYPRDFEQYPMPDFEKKLIAGIVAALDGDQANAQRLLRAAQGSIPPPGDRLIPPDYAFAEILEALTAETGVKAYRDMALAFARGWEAFEPYTAWAYAFDAQYSPAGNARLRAAALALKFDPKSARLAKLDPKLLAQARAWLKQNDPFKEKENAEPPARRSKS